MKPTLAFATLPMSFEPNFGQTDKIVRFLSRGTAYRLFLTGEEAVLALNNNAWDSEKPHNRENFRPVTESTLCFLPKLGCPTETLVDPVHVKPPSVLRMRLLDENLHSRVIGTNRLPGRVNYLQGNDPRHWHTNLPTYANVEYERVYPGIDLVYYGKQGQLEFDFLLAPGASANLIRLRFTGMSQMKLSTDGNLVLSTDSGEITFHRPIVYQEIAGERQKVEGEFKLAANDTVGFCLGEHDPSRPLVIDPVLSYSTYLGGVGQGYTEAIAADASGAAYVTGNTIASDFPTTPGAFETVNQFGQQNVFVTKINASGTAVAYSTYLGGSNAYGNAIAVDKEGNAYVAGSSNDGIPVTAGAFQPGDNSTSSEGINGFVTKLNPTGSGLVYSTYLGGSYGGDAINAIAVDSSGNAFVAGVAASTDFPTTPGAYEPTDMQPGSLDTFVAKLNSTGTDLIYSTYLQGAGAINAGSGAINQAYGIAVDAAGDAIVVGQTSDMTFPVTPGAFQPNYSTDPTNLAKFRFTGYVTKFNPTGTKLLYSSYLGGGSIGGSRAVAVDAVGNAYVTGWTANDFVTTPGAFQTQPRGLNSFVTKVNPMGTAMVYSTQLGGYCSHGVGLGGDTGFAIAVDPSNNAYVAGMTCSPDFPLTTEFVQPQMLSPSRTGFLSVLNTAGSKLLYSTFLGGSGYSGDGAFGVALDGNGNAYLAGIAYSTDFPTTTGTLQPIGGGAEGTGFVAKLKVPMDATPTTNDFTVIASPTLLTVTAGSSATTTLTLTPLNSLYQQVEFDCSGLPSGASCAFSPLGLSNNWTATTVTAIIQTSAAARLLRPNVGPFLPLTLLAVAVWCFAGIRRRPVFSLGLLGLICSLGLVIGCGSGTVGNGGGGAATRQYSVTITATGRENGGRTVLHPVVLNLTVNP